MIGWLRRRELHIFHHIDAENIDRMMRLFVQEIRKMSAASDAILAKVTAQHGVLQSVAIAVDELNGEMGSISEEIARLKKLIEDGQAVDLAALEAKVDEMGVTVDGLLPAIKANPAPEA